MSAQADLFAAVDQKKVAAVKAALAAGADPNLEDDSGYRPLASALELKSKPVALALLEAGADPDLEGRRGSMLLTALESLPDPEVIDALCARGAALNAVSGPKKLAPLHLAVQRPKLDVAAQLLDRGADIERRRRQPGLHAAAPDHRFGVSHRPESRRTGCSNEGPT
jgi:ankyrin repeat protein